MPRRLIPLSAEALGEAEAAGDQKALTKHFLALLQGIAPGKSVEVRVPPYAAIQCIEGVRHTRGTPPAVIEMSGDTWLALARGELAWAAAVASGVVRASGERADLSAYLPLG
ncbi:MAG: sterol carrier family protein [Marmoricola sp.]